MERVKFKKSTKLLNVDLIYLLLLGIIMAFVGWSVENIARLITKGIIDSRYHILPFILPYGLIPLSFQLVFQNADDITIFGHKVFKNKTLKSIIFSNILTLSILYAAVFFGELAIGNFWDHLFNIKLWNYSSQLLHVTPYAGLLSTLGFGTGAYLILKFVHQKALNIVSKIPYKTVLIICCVLLTLMFMDSTTMILTMIIKGEAPNYWSISIR